MLELLKPETSVQPRAGTDAKQVDVCRETPQVRCLAPGEILFQTGDPRGPLYRVESGTLCHYTRRQSGHHEIIEFVFPGAILGFGHVAMHVSTAKAMLDTEVSIVPPHEFECALRTDGQLAARVAAAADREFDYLRRRAMEARADPTQRLASFLLAVSRMSAREGRDATLIPDENPSRAVAERLDMSLDGLASALRQLETWGLVASSPAGLRIEDIAALERLADARRLPHPSHAKLKASDV